MIDIIAGMLMSGIAQIMPVPAAAAAPDAGVQVDVYRISATQRKWLAEAPSADVARLAAGYRDARVRRLTIMEHEGEIRDAQSGNRVIGVPASLTGLTGRLDDVRGTTPILTLTYSRLVAEPSRIRTTTRYTPYAQTDRPLVRVVRLTANEQHFFTTDFNDRDNRVPMLIVVRRMPVGG